MEHKDRLRGGKKTGSGHGVSDELDSKTSWRILGVLDANGDEVPWAIAYLVATWRLGFSSLTV